MFKILKEVSVWTCDYKVYNHTYLLDPKSRILAYLNAKDKKIHKLNSPYQIDKRYRKFIEVKNAKLSKLIPKNYKEKKEELAIPVPREDVRVFKVKSKDKVYAVEYNTKVGLVSCSCIGFGYRRYCRHSDAVAKKLGVK